MTIKLKLKDVKDKLKDETLDLSLCELEEVPVREIVSDFSVLYRKKKIHVCGNFLILTLHHVSGISQKSYKC